MRETRPVEIGGKSYLIHIDDDTKARSLEMAGEIGKLNDDPAKNATAIMSAAAKMIDLLLGDGSFMAIFQGREITLERLLDVANTVTAELNKAKDEYAAVEDKAPNTAAARIAIEDRKLWEAMKTADPAVVQAVAAALYIQSQCRQGPSYIASDICKTFNVG